MAKPKREDAPSGPAEWLLTYSDTMTLLLCFFVLLFSFSTLDAQKWQALVESVKGRLDPTELISAENIIDEIASHGVPTSENDIATLENDNKDIKNFDDLYVFIQSYIDKNGFGDSIELQKGDNFILMRFKGTILFDPDQSVIKPEGKKILEDMCTVLKAADEMVGMIRVEGHTAARPKGQPPFTRTWEFSVERAVNVLRYMLEYGGISTEKISAVGYGQYHPIASNETAEGRSANRRVEIVVTRATESAEGSDTQNTDDKDIAPSEDTSSTYDGVEPGTWGDSTAGSEMIQNQVYGKVYAVRVD